jgi:hypothetical protein
MTRIGCGRLGLGLLYLGAFTPGPLGNPVIGGEHMAFALSTLLLMSHGAIST